MSEIELSSDIGADYTKLQQLLKDEQWQDANRETLALLCKIANQKWGTLEQKSIYMLPCRDLCTINQLLVQYSNEHFGLSVQSQIRKKITEEKEIDFSWVDDYLGTKIGWRIQAGGWLRYSDLTFDLSAPMGHLPCLMPEGERWKNNNLYSVISTIFCFSDKLDHCDYLGICEQIRHQKIWIKKRFKASP